MSFTDQKPRIVKDEDLTSPWAGHTDGSHFYCGLCGHSFTIGDQWRWVYAGKMALPNFMICETCDGDNIVSKWETLHNEWDNLAKGKFRFISTLIKDLEKEIRY